MLGRNLVMIAIVLAHLAGRWVTLATGLRR
jgi:hypothetical protein